MAKRSATTRSRKGEEHERRPGRPKCPTWLPKEARLCWRRTVDALFEEGVIQRLDTHLLTRYCQAYARWQRCVEWIEEHGELRPVYDRAMPEEGFGPNEKPKIRDWYPWPQVKIAKYLEDQMLAIERELGMTPRSRGVFSGSSAQRRSRATPRSGAGKTPRSGDQFFSRGT